MDAEQLRIRTPGYLAAAFRQAPINGGVVAKITWAPAAAAFSMASAAASPGWTSLYTRTDTFAPMTASRYCRPRSWARIQSLASGLPSLMNTTFRWSGNTAWSRRPKMPGAAGSPSSSFFCSSVSVLTEMGSGADRSFISGRTAATDLASSAALRLHSCSNLYTRSHTSRASAGVTSSSSPPCFRRASRK